MRRLSDTTIHEKNFSLYGAMHEFEAKLIGQALDEAGHPVAPGQTGNLCARLPLPPGCAPTLWQNDEGYHVAYLSDFPGWYRTGDAGTIDHRPLGTVVRQHRGNPFHRQPAAGRVAGRAALHHRVL